MESMLEKGTMEMRSILEEFLERRDREKKINEEIRKSNDASIHSVRCDIDFEWQRETNADKIRSMTDDELAEFLYEVSECTTQFSVCTQDCDKCANDAEMCTELIGRWLKE